MNIDNQNSSKNVEILMLLKKRQEKSNKNIRIQWKRREKLIFAIFTKGTRCYTHIAHIIKKLD